MPFRRFRRPDEQAAERLLDTVVTAGVDPSDEPVARLLATAAAPARPGELAGEDVALAAFRAARAQRPAPVPDPPRPRRTARAAAWLAGLAVVATAGVAVATVDLHRSDPPPAPPAPTTGTPAPPESAPTPTRTPSTATDAPTTGPRPGAGPGRSTDSRGPAAHRGLCTAYLATSAGQRAKALKTPAFRALTEAAGGPGRVEEYCGELVDAPPGRHPTPTDRPGHDKRTEPPTARPSKSR
ncbi:hypothetical protein ACIBJE_04305 [Micromonospora sp. NPDC050187]|uniref:hypothetical protein n=1 Tax=Micromonospora sp. NPDC050187 TaxID=3364277 RepID=UPI00379B967B